MTEKFTPEEVLKNYKRLETKKEKLELAQAFGWMWDEVMELLVKKSSKGKKKYEKN